VFNTTTDPNLNVSSLYKTRPAALQTSASAVTTGASAGSAVAGFEGPSRPGELTFRACAISEVSPPAFSSASTVAGATSSGAGAASYSGTAVTPGETGAGATVPTIASVRSTSSEGAVALSTCASSALSSLRQREHRHRERRPHRLPPPRQLRDLRRWSGEPRHGDPVALHHEPGLRKGTTISRLKALVNARLQPRPYL
jgi:hypothetical protein